MPYSVAAKNSMLDHLGTEATYASLHSADPGDTGANELSGGSPAYARKAITWNPASGGSMDDSNVPVFDVPPGGKVLYVGYWSALTDGVWQGGDLVPEENYTGQGIYNLTDVDLDLNG